MEWLVSSVWKWTKRKIMFPSTVKGSPAQSQRFVSEKTCIHIRAEMSCLILWSVIERYRPDRNTEEELIKDYDTADSQNNL